jgi:hypothetical protein
VKLLYSVTQPSLSVLRVLSSLQLAVLFCSSISAPPPTPRIPQHPQIHTYQRTQHSTNDHIKPYNICRSITNYLFLILLSTPVNIHKNTSFATDPSHRTCEIDQHTHSGKSIMAKIKSSASTGLSHSIYPVHLVRACISYSTVGSIKQPSTPSPPPPTQR